MAKRGKNKPTVPAVSPEKRAEMSVEARRERLLGLGLSGEEVDRHFAVTSTLDAAAAEARQSEKRLDIDDAIDAGIIRIEGPRQQTAEEVKAAYTIPLSDDEWSDFPVTEEERNAPLCAVFTPDELAAVLDKAVDDGVAYEKPAAGAVMLDELWASRALVMAEERGLTLKQFLEACVKEAWVRRPLRKRGP